MYILAFRVSGTSNFHLQWKKEVWDGGLTDLRFDASDSITWENFLQALKWHLQTHPNDVLLLQGHDPHPTDKAEYLVFVKDGSGEYVTDNVP